MARITEDNDSVRSSRAGHTFHERWAARRALQLVFPKDDLFAIAVEGISTTETAKPGAQAEEVADLVMYYGNGDNFTSCSRLETAQFKFKLSETQVTASYLKKTIEKFCDTICGYDKEFSAADVDAKLSFVFVTNAEFSTELWAAIGALKTGIAASNRSAATQSRYLSGLCAQHDLPDPSRLFSRIEFRAGEKSLPGQDNALRRTLTDWSAGADPQAKIRLLGLQDLVLKKADPSGQHKNLIRREDVLDALDCVPEDLFPADTRFIDVGQIVGRADLATVADLIKVSEIPVFLHADGGVGKTVFVQSLAAELAGEFETVVFDCFGGGAYRSDDHSRHLPSIGLVQIVNELASRTLCDPLLPGADDSRNIVRAAWKRLAQAANAIRTQSEKQGILVIIDAADNAQLEADHRHEDAFPKLLLSSLDGEAINGVKLLLTARTHRKDKVIDRARVKAFELGPFTEDEAKQFLEGRRPGLSNVELATALARSVRNPRVLDYLVQTWDLNVLDSASATPITVREIIAQRCDDIVSDLHLAGWPDQEVREFFVALSLLPPPIPLEELANALGWPGSQVNTAASDLAPMLEVVTHGAIFRDEPTETYVRDTYSENREAQRAIAERLLSSQAASAYAAEALPHFLVVINDSDRAFALADSDQFPSTLQSDFGRRRLVLARLRAAFRLAVAADDFDRVLGLTMRLAQVATANMRGDAFIRRSPALAIMLGDPDAYRRLFADRSGWRGARSARLTIAHSFAGDMEEALIQRESTIRWVNWNAEQPQSEPYENRPGPEAEDFAAILFQSIVDNEYKIVDRNLSHWSDRLSLSVSDRVLDLLELFERAGGVPVLGGFVAFAASEQCKSHALKLRLLSRPRLLKKAQTKAIAKALSNLASLDSQDDDEAGFEPNRENDGDVIQAALTLLLNSSRASASSLIRHVTARRPSSHDYGDRYGPSKAWSVVLPACIRAWSAGRKVTFHDLLPDEIKITRSAKAIATGKELLAFLKEQLVFGRKDSRNPKSKKAATPRYNERERDDICAAIELTLALIQPIEVAVLAGKGFSEVSFDDFLAIWLTHLRPDKHWKSETAADILARNVGLGCARILVTHASEVTVDQARQLIEIISGERFFVHQKLGILTSIAHRPLLHALAGQFAGHVAEQIRKDDNIGQRGESYADLSASVISMSVDEAREYYRQGLAQLDQMGGEDYDQIYSLLHYASAQSGGFIKPALAQRLMNLCQTIARDDSSKFGWGLFADAAATSIGFGAISKLVRWHDQDVAKFSYGLPQLGCFLAKDQKLDPRRAAFLLTICEDHGWWNWQVGDGVTELMALSAPVDRRRIFKTILEKLRAEHVDGAWPSAWTSLLKVGDQYPAAITADERAALETLKSESQRKQDEFNSRNSSTGQFLEGGKGRSKKEDGEKVIDKMARDCDFASSAAIDAALRHIRENDFFAYGAAHRFLESMRECCPYDKRLAFLLAICEASEVELGRATDVLVECVATWSASSAHLISNAKSLVERLFEFKGAELFDTAYSNLSRRILQLSEFCGDTGFVLKQVLRKVAVDETELDGDEWLQLATNLCAAASGKAGLEALELFLSGPTSRMADEIGEGALRPDQEETTDEAELVADIVWHLLGDDDGYIRWSVARNLEAFVFLGLEEELGLLLDRFDRTEIPALVSPDRRLPFQNSQQWLLMGLARATLRHGKALAFLRPRLVALAGRDDIHVLHKVHIARCLQNIADGQPDADLKVLQDRIDAPQRGVVENDGWSKAVKSASGFSFDYEFNKTEISNLAHLFGIHPAVATDAVAAEITKRWPDATNLDYFPGNDRYRRDSEDRYEFYREHVQRHALISAATTLMAASPIVVRSYEVQERSPWLEWRDRFDITFDDGSWLSDRKDTVPPEAGENLLGQKAGDHLTLQDQQAVFCKIGLVNDRAASLPLYGRWTSPDGVSVRIVSALTEGRGSIGRCGEFSKRDSRDFRLPEFWDGGYYHNRSGTKSVFHPLVWSPDSYGIGIDVGDEIAAKGAAARPRLGIDLTSKLKITNGADRREWHAEDGALALRSQVWGSWQPDPDYNRGRQLVEGEVLWAQRDWLDQTLAQLQRRLVFTITLWKYKTSRDYDTSTGVKSVFVGLRADDGNLRWWHARKASQSDY